MATHETNDLRDQPIGDIAGQLTRDLSLLVRQELELAKAEMREKSRVALMGIGMFSGAGIVGVCAAGTLTAFLVLLFALFLDTWLAALVVGLLLAAVAAGLALLGKKRVEEVGSPLPETAIEHAKEDAQWLKEQAKSARS